MFFIIWAIIAAAIVLAVLLVKVKIEIIAVQEDITVNIIFLGFIKITKKLLIKFEEKSLVSLYLVDKNKQKRIVKLKKIINNIIEKAPDRTFTGLVSYFLKYINKGQKEVVYSHIYKRINYYLKVYIQLGTGDAFVTAISCGFLKAVSNAFCAILNSRIHKTNINLSPEYSEQVISVKVNCIIRFSPADIIIGYSVSKIIEAVRKNASDRKYNADCDGRNKGNG